MRYSMTRVYPWPLSLAHVDSIVDGNVIPVVALPGARPRGLHDIGQGAAAHGQRDGRRHGHRRAGADAQRRPHRRARDRRGAAAAADCLHRRRAASGQQRGRAVERAARHPVRFVGPRRRVRPGACAHQWRAGSTMRNPAITTATCRCRSEEIDRIEVVLGGGSSLHGADATGGTVNVITRGGGRRLHGRCLGRAASPRGNVGDGGGGAAGMEHVVSGAFNRSSGFMPARDHSVALGRYQATLRPTHTATLGFSTRSSARTVSTVPHRRANGPTSCWPRFSIASRARIDGRRPRTARIALMATISSMTSGIRPSRRAGIARTPSHRTCGGTGPSPRARRSVLPPAAGTTRITSNNLGEHAFSRGSLAMELRQGLGIAHRPAPGVRVDTYSRFGTSWSPSLSVSGWTSDSVRLRGSAGHVFRVPTFTELFYVDPNHQGAGALSPETAWSADAGVDSSAGSWTAGATVYAMGGQRHRLGPAVRRRPVAHGEHPQRQHAGN